MKRSVVIDIETIGQDEARLRALAPEFKPAANLKDPAKIAASLEEKRAAYIERAALDWKTAEVVLVGFHDGKAFEAIMGNTGLELRPSSRAASPVNRQAGMPALQGSEAEVVERSLSLISRMLFDGVFVGGHNIKGFDLPMLLNRARVLGVPVPEGILVPFKGRLQWAEGFFDTLEILSFGRTFDGNGCDDCARAFGLPGKLGSGGDFPALWKSDREAAIAYNRRDCEIEILLAQRCGY